MKYSSAFALAFAAIWSVAADAAAIVYTGTHQVGSYSALVTVTTDGTFGSIDSTNITDFRLDLTAGGSVYAFDRTNGELFVTEPLRADATTLVLPFPITFDGNHEFAIRSANRFNQFFAVGAGSVFSSSYAETIFVRGVGIASQDVTGDYTIGTVAAVAVPEPATWAMLVGGVGLAGGALRRHRRVPAAVAA